MYDSGALLLNVLGHAAGALIFGIFLFLLLSGRGWAGLQGRYLPALAASLALVWNLGSLMVLVWPRMPVPVHDFALMGSFSALSLLPAVLLQVSLEGDLRPLALAGYALGGIAAGMHCWEILGNGAQLHDLSLLLITVGFLVLTAAAVGNAALRRPGRGSRGARIGASMCLALFAVSFVHFGAGHTSEAWPSELFIHHAGIVLAMLILLQDYRFVLLDAFVRFLANALLAAVLTFAAIQAIFHMVLSGRPQPGPLEESLLIISLCLFLILFAWLRNVVHAWLTRVVFQQRAMAGIADRLRDGAGPEPTEQEYLHWAAAEIASALRTERYAVAGEGQLQCPPGLDAPVLAAMCPAVASSKEWNWAEAVVPVRTGQDRSRFLVLGRREGGRRYLGEDLSALSRASAAIAERVEYLRRQELGRLVSQAELRALQSQINPHFLFNALNTLYGTIPREAAAARRMVLNLAEVFRYFLQTDKTFVPLSREMEIVCAYLEVEQSRLGSRLRVETDVDPEAVDVPIPVLSLQPLAENAVKHGIAPRSGPGYIRIQATREADRVRIAIENSGGEPSSAVPGTGVGLENVRRRLAICYGAAADLRLSFEPEKTTAEVTLPLEPAKHVSGSVQIGGRQQR